jgi:hypothetical protein
MLAVFTNTCFPMMVSAWMTEPCKIITPSAIDALGEIMGWMNSLPNFTSKLLVNNSISALSFITMLIITGDSKTERYFRPKSVSLFDLCPPNFFNALIIIKDTVYSFTHTFQYLSNNLWMTTCSVNNIDSIIKFIFQKYLLLNYKYYLFLRKHLILSFKSI